MKRIVVRSSRYGPIACSPIGRPEGSSPAGNAVAGWPVGRGVGVLTERPRFGLLASKLHDHDQPLRITLHATWDPEHRAARAISELVEGLAVHLTLVKAGIAAEQEWTEY